jgi:hypothetical protein
VAGSVVLDAQASSSSPRRVLYINPGSSGVVQVIGLGITGGYLFNSVRSHVQKFPLPQWECLADMHFDLRLFGGGSNLVLPGMGTCQPYLQIPIAPMGDSRVLVVYRAAVSLSRMA